MKRSCYAIIFAILLCFGISVRNAHASPTDILSQSEQALVSGNPERARALADVVIDQEPSNYAALILLSLAHADLGADHASADAATYAYRVATTADQRLQAARIVASAHFKVGQYTRAQWWLRRAGNHIDTRQDAAKVQQEFTRIRTKNPLRVNLGFSVAPSDNINNGSESESFFLEGLDFEFFLPESSLALSGIEYAGDVFAAYDLSQGPNHRTQLQGYIFGRTFSLSRKSQEAVPDISGNDYALMLTEAAINHSRLLQSGWGPTSVSAHIGKAWFSGDPLWDYRKLSLAQTIPEGVNDTLTIGGSFEDRTARRATQSDTQVTYLYASQHHIRTNQDKVTITVSGLSQDAAFETDSFTEYRGNIVYHFDQPLIGTHVSVSGELGYKNYDEFTLSLDGRRDRYASLGGTVVFDSISYFGFAPTVALTATRTESNVTQFTTSQLQARVGVQSTF
ncbi:tetratricopeptide repeat protein [Yoonia maritima]|uniref:tetratricopeptide repeat protein n=1 Tax=Yoonia maritima TaxID=1435347 RepID=UPI000D110727|nr:surface lipoprotein assembly modifier [Yoonia maritima]